MEKVMEIEQIIKASAEINKDLDVDYEKLSDAISNIDNKHVRDALLALHRIVGNYQRLKSVEQNGILSILKNHDDVLQKHKIKSLLRKNLAIKRLAFKEGK